MKDKILDKCDERNDKWASDVRLRVSGAVSDLHAANARYHKDCRSIFFYQRSTPVAAKAGQPESEVVDEGFDCVITVLQEDLSRIWNIVELHWLYHDNGGIILSRRLLITRLSEHFGDDLFMKPTGKEDRDMKHTRTET